MSQKNIKSEKISEMLLDQLSNSSQSISGGNPETIKPSNPKNPSKVSRSSRPSGISKVSKASNVRKVTKKVSPVKSQYSDDDLDSLTSHHSSNSSQVASRITDYDSSLNISSIDPVSSKGKVKKNKKYAKPNNPNEHQNPDDVVSFSDKVTSKSSQHSKRTELTEKNKYYLPQSKQLVGEFGAELDRSQVTMRQQRDYYHQPHGYQCPRTSQGNYHQDGNYSRQYNGYSQQDCYHNYSGYGGSGGYGGYGSYGGYNGSYPPSCNYYSSGYVQVAGQQPTNWVYDTSNVNYNKLLNHSYF